jgi:hypothetical protein
MSEATPEAPASQPQVVSEETVVAPANGGDRQRTPSEASQPAALLRPLEESARLANERDSDTILGKDYTVSNESGYRRA